MNPSNSSLLIPGMYKKTRIYPYLGIDFGGSDNLLNTSLRDYSKYSKSCEQSTSAYAWAAPVFSVVFEAVELMSS